ncbi:hypothetical protein GCK72_016793 [Caenorhabditis remanei]|uniref:Domain of unknown function WSN domain-containing protein n=1 Tax=Caenorhabditis remanei TaxID=31234 RepID=A0A6A5G5V2_CAERE|nr:hypothetical protein GCK72_016793 [Caenorhabditis remanei]KAF1750246.1 hypothetical protein GCK72_016793 [Caenorhabditis remanei]
MLMLWLLCLVILSPCVTIEQTPAEIVDTAINALSAANNRSGDALLSLNEFGPKLTSLMKAYVPLGALMYKATKKKPESAEFRALMDFRARAEKIWKIQEKRARTATRTAKILNSEYIRTVKELIRFMKSSADRYLNPDYKKMGYQISEFESDCMRETIQLKVRFNFLLDYCTSISHEEAQQLADHRRNLMNAFLRFRVKGNEPLPDIELYIMEFIDIEEEFLRKFKFVSQEDMGVYHNSFFSYHEAIEAYFNEMRYKGSIIKREYFEDGCQVRELLRKSNFNYTYVEAFATEFMSELLDLTFVEAICDNALHNSTTELSGFRLLGDMIKISSFTSNWLNMSLDSAWPSAHVGILEEQIKRAVKKPGEVTRENLKMVAEKTHPLLLNTGTQGYGYEFVVIEATDKNYEFFFDDFGHHNHCVYNRGDYGFDTVIGRILLNSTDRDFTVAEKIFRKGKQAEKLNEIIQSEMSKIYAAKTLPLIVDTLKKKIGSGILKEFQCWAVAREWSYFPCPTIDYWASPFIVSNLESITTLSYRNKGRFYQYCQEFRFFFFA